MNFFKAKNFFIIVGCGCLGLFLIIFAMSDFMINQPKWLKFGLMCVGSMILIVGVVIAPVKK